MDWRSISEYDKVTKGEFISNEAMKYKVKSKAIELIIEEVITYLENLPNAICWKNKAENLKEWKAIIKKRIGMHCTVWKNKDLIPSL